MGDGAGGPLSSAPPGRSGNTARVHVRHGERHVLAGRPGPDGAVHDPLRIRYVARHTAAVRQAIGDGANVRGYFLWSFMDNFEWGFGFTKRFGMTWVDYETQKRVVKDSGRWYGKAARGERLPVSDAEGMP